MNHWTQLSIDIANQMNYLDLLFQVYPCMPEEIRDIDQNKWDEVKRNFDNKNNKNLIKSLLGLPLFPIKDSYIAYLKRDKSAIDRNPETVNRICSRLYVMGLTKIFEQSTLPKETNRQIGPLFKRWISSDVLGIPLLPLTAFSNTKDNAILVGSDADLKHYASKHLGYTGTKGLDLLLRMHNKYVIGEAKFLTDFGGHQDRQLEDALSLLEDTSARAIHIAILDGVLYIPGKHSMHRSLSLSTEKAPILSSLVLREYLYQV